MRGQAQRDTALASAVGWARQATAPSPLRSAGAFHKRPDLKRPSASKAQLRLLGSGSIVFSFTREWFLL